MTGATECNGLQRAGLMIGAGAVSVAAGWLIGDMLRDLDSAVVGWPTPRIVELWLRVTLPLGNAALAILISKATDWRSWVPAIVTFPLFSRLGVSSPVAGLLLALALVCWAVVLLVRSPHRRSVRVWAIIACAVCTAAWQFLEMIRHT
jgi:hypothetical protein